MEIVACYRFTCIAAVFAVHLLHCSIATAEKEWTGEWFPSKPGEPDPFLKLPVIDNTVDNRYSPREMKSMGILNPNCDDGRFNISVDYDPDNWPQVKRSICFENRTIYNPNIDTPPILREYEIPAEYSALHRCMNESIEYDYNIPTFGTHRGLWPVYGKYSYVPPQRWLHNLEHGGIVALYHPCANLRLIDDLSGLVEKCLFRHIITPYEKLTPERPFALVAWGRSFETSIINHEQIIGFIRMNALHGPEKTARNGQYLAGLEKNAKVVSDENDSNLCPNM